MTRSSSPSHSAPIYWCQRAGTRGAHTSTGGCLTPTCLTPTPMTRLLAVLEIDKCPTCRRPVRYNTTDAVSSRWYTPSRTYLQASRCLRLPAAYINLFTFDVPSAPHRATSPSFCPTHAPLGHPPADHKDGGAREQNGQGMGSEGWVEPEKKSKGKKSMTKENDKP